MSMVGVPAGVGQEHGPMGAAGEQARQDAGGAGLKVDELEISSLRADPSALVRKVEILDVERQNLAGTPGGLIEQPPERLLTQRHRLAGEEALEHRIGDRSRPVGQLPPAA
jgi:hypothetical protein